MTIRYSSTVLSSDDAHDMIGSTTNQGAGINTDTTGHLVSTDTTGHLIHSGGSSSTGSAGVVNSDTDPQIESLDTTGVLSSDDAHDMVHFEDSWPGSDGR